MQRKKILQHNALYYHPTKNRRVYTSQPKGTLSISRAINQKRDHWQYQAPKDEEVKLRKKIILTDPMVKVGRNTQMRVEVLLALLEDEFEIYIINNRRLLRINTLEALYHPAIQITPLRKKQVIEIAIANGFERQEIFDLNYFTMNQFIHEDFNVHFIPVIEIEESPELLALVPDLKQFVLKFSTESFMYIESQLPKYFKCEGFYGLEIEEYFDKSALIQFSSISDTIFNSVDTKKVKYFSLIRYDVGVAIANSQSDEFSSQLIKIFEKLPVLEILKIDRLDEDCLYDLRNHIQKPSPLKELKVDVETPESVTDTIEMFPLLEKLSIKIIPDYESISNNENLLVLNDIYNLKQLKELTICLSNTSYKITPSQIGELLCKCEELSALTIVHDTFIKSDTPDERILIRLSQNSPKLTSLRMITCNPIDTRPADQIAVVNYISQCKHLKNLVMCCNSGDDSIDERILNYRYVSNIQSELNLVNHVFKDIQLEYFEISECQMGTQDVYTLLTNARLESICISTLLLMDLCNITAYRTESVKVVNVISVTDTLTSNRDDLTGDSILHAIQDCFPKARDIYIDINSVGIDSEISEDNYNECINHSCHYLSIENAYNLNFIKGHYQSLKILQVSGNSECPTNTAHVFNVVNYFKKLKTLNIDLAQINPNNNLSQILDEENPNVNSQLETIRIINTDYSQTTGIDEICRLFPKLKRLIAAVNDAFKLSQKLFELREIGIPFILFAFTKNLDSEIADRLSDVNITPIITMTELKSHQAPNNLDSFTGPPNKPQHVVKKLWSSDGEAIDPGLYLCDVYNKVNSTEDGFSLTTETQIKRFEVIEINDNLSKMKKWLFQDIRTSTQSLGDVELQLTQDIQPLTILTPHDEIVMIYADQPDTYFGYCEKTRNFYVKNAARIPVETRILYTFKKREYAQSLQPILDLNLFSPLSDEEFKIMQQLRFTKNFELEDNVAYQFLMSIHDNNEKLQVIAQYISTFDGIKGLSKQLFNQVELLNAYVDEKVGACRHRTMLFFMICYALRDKSASDKASLDCYARSYVVDGDVHSRVVVLLGADYRIIDLGGTPVELVLHDDPKDIEHIANSYVQNRKLIANNNNNNYNHTLTRPSHDDINDRFEITTLNDNNRFAFWKTRKIAANDAAEYLAVLLQRLESLSPGCRNAVIIVNDAVDIPLLQAFIAYTITHNREPYFYLPSLSEIIFKDSHVVQNNLRVIDSYFVQRLKDAAHPLKVLAINYNEFEKSHVGLNTMLDKGNRRLYMDTGEPNCPPLELPIHPNTSIIAFLPKHKIAEMGEDYFSRFPIKVMLTVPLPVLSLYQSMPIDKSFSEVEFYDDDTFKDILIGKPCLGMPTQYINGALINALDEHRKGLILVNAPTDSSEFMQLYSDLITTRKFYANGREYVCPNDFAFIFETKSYDLTTLQNIIYSDCFDLNEGYDVILNHLTLTQFSVNYAYENQLIECDGWIKKFAGKYLRVYVTETLQPGEWVYLSKEAQKYNCQLILFAERDNLIPSDIRKTSNEDDSPPKKQARTREHANLFILTNDLAYTLAIEKEQLQKNGAVHHFHITMETECSDLIPLVQLPENSRSLNDFCLQIPDVWKLLMAGETVILTGQLNTEVAETLAPLLQPHPKIYVNGEFITPPGSLLIISEQEDLFKQIAILRQYSEYQPNQGFLRLKKEYPAEWVYFVEQINAIHQLNFNYQQKLTLLNYFKEVKFSFQAFKQLLLLSVSPVKLREIKNTFTALQSHPEHKSQKPTEEIMSKRKRKIFSILEKAPYVFIAGETGVGKSTMIEELEEEYTYLIFLHGLKKLTEWATKDPEGKTKILVVDEANTCPEAMIDLFEALYHKKLLINGKIHDIEGKVIFMGNPVQYGGDRKQHRLFNNHGNQIWFDDLPPEFLRERIVVPLLNKLTPQLSREELDFISQYFVSTYMEMKNVKSLIVPMTMRNLQMICLRFATLMDVHNQAMQSSFAHNNPNIIRAQLAFYLETRSLFNTKDKASKNKWKHRLFFDPAFYKEFKREEEAKISCQFTDYVLTKERKKYFYRLDQQLKVRNIRIAFNDKKLGGKRAMLFEGPSGVGKSTMAMRYIDAKNITAKEASQYLNTNGYVNANQQLALSDYRQSMEKSYIQITPTDKKLMEAALLQAFHEGRIVIIDELNILPIEDLLNQLLTGRDLDNKPPKKEGFFVIATQNPATFNNRNILPIALLNRLELIQVKDYTRDELRYILKEKYQADDNDIDAFVDEYLSSITSAEQQDLEPRATPRDFFECAENVFGRTLRLDEF